MSTNESPASGSQSVSVGHFCIFKAESAGADGEPFGMNGGAVNVTN